MHGKDIVLQEDLELVFLHPDDSTSFIGSDAPVFDQVITGNQCRLHPLAGIACLMA
jgi:hypothetical protein